MKTYKKPELKLTKFKVNDVITSSWFFPLFDDGTAEFPDSWGNTTVDGGSADYKDSWTE